MGWVVGAEISTLKYICRDFDGTLAYRSGTWHQPEAEHTHITDGEGWWSSMRPVFVNAFQAVLRCSEDEARELSLLVRPAYIDEGARVAG